MAPRIDFIIDRQLRRWEMEREMARRAATGHESTPAARPLLTLSRQHGSSGVLVAEHLARELGYTLLHRDIVDRMAGSTGVARRLLEALDERARGQIATWVEGMVAGQYVDADDYVRALLRTLRSIAQLGGVVVVGRGANFIVGPEAGFHVRIVAPRGQRIRSVAERKGLSPRDAAREVDQRDRERADFVRRVFQRSVDDPLAYDVIVNAGGRSPGEVSAWLASAARAKFERLGLVELPSY